MSSPMIELRGIHKSYGAEKVLENLDLRMEKGGFTVLLGPSGCGKSTILRLIAGLEAASAGDVLIDGASMREVPPGDRGIAMVFQNYALYPTMTVRENIEYGLKNGGIAKKERDRRIAEIVEIVGLGDYLKKKPRFLSGGQRQRVALARAMVKQPRIFLMDEPLSNLDAKLRGQLRKDLIELYRRLGSTFVYVTHDQVEAMSLGTKVILLEKGRIRQEAAPEEIYAKPANVFSARFIGTPPMNIIDADQAVSALSPGTRHIGFRPEKARITVDRSELPAGASVFPGELVTREMLGSEVLYQVNGPGWKAQVKLYENRRIPYGPVFIYVDRKDIFSFDVEGNSMEGPAPGGNR
ncbi:MAG TPA: ABC transporter ATP-binding protein [Rectinemataceae bacterium]|nr:ABC transporter ATP-binding protein [Rectinemataceae bacterium]